MLAALQFGQLRAAQVFVDLPKLALRLVELEDRRLDLGKDDRFAGFLDA